jgi:hypothetical protein
MPHLSRLRESVRHGTARADYLRSIIFMACRNPPDSIRQ